jgi:hypothetical protein
MKYQNYLKQVSALLSLAALLMATTSLMGQSGTVVGNSKLSDTQGNLTESLEDEDNFGRSIALIDDLDGDGVNDMVVGADGDDDKVGGGGPVQDRGAVYVLFLNNDGSVKSEQKISDTQGGFSAGLEKDDEFGRSVASCGDLDGDGNCDIAVGATGDDDGGGRRGAVYILFLNSNGTVKSHQKISDLSGSFSGTLDDDDQFGSAVANIGDLDNDGVTDLAVGAYGDQDGGGNYRGAVWVLFMNTNGTVASHQKISDTQGGFNATLDDYDSFGWSIAALGDLNGDGNEDIAVGAEQDDDGGSARGAVHMLFLNSNGTVSSENKISDFMFTFTGELSNNDRFGFSITATPDMNGDGYNDMIVSARADDDGGTNRGAIYSLFLDQTGNVRSYEKISDTQGNFTGTLDDSDVFGTAVCNLGDLNGDGDLLIAVGAEQDDDGGTDRGAVWLNDVQGAAVLPIELLTFSGENQPNAVELKWATALEINNDYFTVERSTDGSNFEAILTVNGAGSSNNVQNYVALDHDPVTGIAYYRLKQTDYDGQFEYSGTIAVEFAANGVASMNIYPNPKVAGQPLNIELDNMASNEEVLVVLFDQMSREVFSSVVITEDSGVLRAEQDFSDLAAGVYLIVASSNDQVFKKKLIVSPSGRMNMMASR